MERHDVPGGMFLRPMRIMEKGESSEIPIEGGDFSLKPPEGEWPGSMYGDLLRVHWECIITFHREDCGPIMWVQPLIVSHKMKTVENPNITVSDGRAESDML